MTARLIRTVLVGVLTLGLFVNRPAAQEPTNDPLEGIVVERSSFGYAVYRALPAIWPVPDISLSPYIARWPERERRKLFLAVFLNGVEDELLSPVIVSFDGTAVSLDLADHPMIDRSGCEPTAAQSIQDYDDLVRRISMATHVQVAYEGTNVLLKATLTPEDLEQFRRIIALWDMDVLPLPLPPENGSHNNPRMFAPLPEGVSNPTLITSTKVRPRYPGKARAKGRTGRVVLAARILKDGTVGTLRPLSISPRGCGFAETAMEAVKQWKYSPAMKDGQTVEVDFTIVVDFVLDKPPGPSRRHHRSRH